MITVAFDAKDYRKRVLSPYTRAKQPLLRAAIGELQQDPGLRTPSRFDLVELYDVPEGATDAEVVQHLADVEQAIRTFVRLPNGSKEPLRLHELLVERNPDLRTAAFWSEALATRARARRAALAEFGTDAAGELSALGVVTRSMLRELAGRAGVSAAVPDADLVRVVEEAGVVVVPELRPPSVPPQLLREIAAGVRRSGGRSVLSVLFLGQTEPDGFTILEGLRVPSAAPALTLQTLERAFAYAQRLPETDETNAAIKMLTAMRGGLRGDDALHGAVVASFLELGRQTFEEVGIRRGARKALAERTGLDPTEAARIILHVAPAGASARRSWSDVQALIADGALMEARRLYDLLAAEQGGTTGTEQDAVGQALEGTERRVAELTRAAREAAARGDLAEAATGLRQALTLCTDDEALAAAARDLPPAAPVAPAATVAEDGRVVRLTWEAGYGSAEDVRYRVVRRVGAAPRNHLDGTPLAGEVDGTRVDDTAPPVAVPVHYGIAATRGQGASPVAVARVLVLPPVTEVVVSSDPSSVSLRWRTPAEARAVEVVQTAPDGTTTRLRSGAHSGVTSSGLRTGATYTYVLTARYTGDRNQDLASAPVRVTGVPRGVAGVVRGLTVGAPVAPGAPGAGPEVAAAWPAVDGYPVEVWHYAQRPAWPVGARLGMEHVRHGGTQLSGRATPRADGHEVLVGPAGEGLRWYVPVTRDGDTGYVGEARAFGTAPPVRDLRAARFGTEAVVSWTWPGPQYEVRVAWRGREGAGERTIAPSEYRRDGGCRVPVGSGGGTIEVVVLTGEGAERWTSVPERVEVPGVERSVRYDVRFRRGLLGPPTAATLTFDVDVDAGAVPVVVVGRHSRVMPFDATQGAELARATVSAASPAVEVALPRGRGTFWLRAFADEPGSRLVDPVLSRLKVE